MRVVDTPGHTPGAVSYVVDGNLFTGDALRLSHGRVHPFLSRFTHAASERRRSIRALARIPGIDALFTAHHGMTADVTNAFSGWRDT